MSRQFAPTDPAAIPVTCIDSDAMEAALANLPPDQAGWAETSGFSGALGEVCPLPNGAGGMSRVLLGRGDVPARARQRFALGAAIAALPDGTYRLDTALPEDEMREAALGYLLAGYRFGRYKEASTPKARLVAPEGLDATLLETIAAGEVLTRDLINTPANDMGPDALELAVRDLANAFGAAVDVTLGDTLIEANFPLIHAVGRASDTAPRLIEMTWGTTGPTLTLVGKGVCFDTGGLNLKPGASMGLMKKDMGGSATVLGLARMIMGAGLPVRLRVLIPAVENAVSGNAFRPGDILTARNGLTVEINNTDAEGRLVLADALAFATETPSDLLICMATLTGAARVAVGPDLAPFYTDDEQVAAALSASGAAQADPVWRMPFHAPYETMIQPTIADLDNAPKGGFAGSITAALFLRRFARAAPRFAHFDIYGWQPVDAPARPKGGVGQGARAIFATLPEVLNL
ncbi:leucyl aminopeptidase family protein [Nioella nitratireducens]|uniref:leucyl aminopeptidase family protein n=1 Tax=Nioella nitratireducens TaxID=1287720 RepID=UPI0008FCF54B|nr:leucyl aminopeptidase family protein [Nioella nitratireducens]